MYNIPSWNILQGNIDSDYISFFHLVQNKVHV